MTTFTTVQMSSNAPGGAHMIHLGPPGTHGGVGNNLCGLNRHDGGYGFSVGGGWADPDAFPCPDCLGGFLADQEPKVSGMFADLFRQHVCGCGRPTSEESPTFVAVTTVCAGCKP